MKQIITRFAPSPTGFLHIGSARTALFNYLFAKKNNGKFLLRIEDTDKARSTEESIQAIISGLTWLDLKWDGDIVFQSQRADRHADICKELLEKGNAYYCFESQENIDLARQKAIDNNEHFLFKSPWRDYNDKAYPKDIKPVIRLKAPRVGSTIIEDNVQGRVEVQNDHLDDMVLLRSDGTPTYMLAVVVDDIDMGVTHIIRGDDHLTNAARQILIYKALGVEVPNMTHIPLIHGDDGHKLSKRHGALGVDAYKDMGYLPEALFSYLLKLGWSHGDDDIISKEQAILWFDLQHLGASPSRLDFAKMRQVNSYYLHHKGDKEICDIIIDDYSHKGLVLTQGEKDILTKAAPHIKIRAELVTQLAALAEIFLVDTVKFQFTEQALVLIESWNKELVQNLVDLILIAENFDRDILLSAFKDFAKANNLKIAELMMILRILITGKDSGIGVLDIIDTLGRDNVINKVQYSWSKIN